MKFDVIEFQMTLCLRKVLFWEEISEEMEKRTMTGMIMAAKNLCEYKVLWFYSLAILRVECYASTAYIQYFK